MNKIITVRGSVDVEKCGMILSHEHLFIDLRNQALPDAQSRSMVRSDRKMLEVNPYCMTDNLLLDNFDSAVKEVSELQKYGCNTVVDCTPADIGRNPRRLKKLSEQTGLNIVMGCGWYTDDTHSAGFTEKNAEQLAEELISEILNGINDSGIKPGIIGEIGTGNVISEGEMKALSAAAAAQKNTGLALQVHIYPWSENGIDVVRKLTDEGVAPDRIVICHSDVQPSWKYIRKLLDYGVYVELDNFGKEFTPGEKSFAGGSFATDRERAELASDIIQAGFGRQLLLTNDICLKCMTAEYGGEGYSHIFRNIIPMIASYGIPENYLHESIMRANPLRMITGKKLTENRYLYRMKCMRNVPFE